MKHTITKDTLVQAYLTAKGSMAETARILNVPRTNVYRWAQMGWLDEVRQPGVSQVVDEKVLEGRLEALKNERKALPKGLNVKRYILTSAQNNTRLHDAVWENIQALAAHYQAEILVGTYTYNLTAYGKQAVKYGTVQENDNGLWYDERLVPFIKKGDNKNIELAPGLVWCGRANILPTAERPLSGFETYTGQSSGIFPHAKIAMQSIPSGKYEKVKFNYTTGTVTQRNYIQKKAGLKAEHHHTYGALIVEVTGSGDWFVRQLNADADGVLHDLDVKVAHGTVTTGNRVLAINWGDIHLHHLEEWMRELCWGGPHVNGMCWELSPKYQFFHDLLDFRSRNHHDRNHWSMYEKHVTNTESVEAEMKKVALFLQYSKDPRCKSVVVDSNHDSAFSRWLREADFRTDPVNARYFLQAQLAKYRAMEDKQPINMLEWAMRQEKVRGICYLWPDESFVVAGIECGMHGHLGPNGTRGGPRNLSRIGRKANIGHTHSAEIHDGLYVAGVTGSLDQGYNVGPSSWSHSHIVTYPNGKRAIVTITNKKWRA